MEFGGFYTSNLSYCCIYPYKPYIYPIPPKLIPQDATLNFVWTAPVATRHKRENNRLVLVDKWNAQRLHCLPLAERGGGILGSVTLGRPHCEQRTR